MSSKKLILFISIIMVMTAAVAIIPSGDSDGGTVFEVSLDPQDGSTGAALKYQTISDSEVEVINSNGAGDNNESYQNITGSITVPSTVEYNNTTYTVTGIGKMAFTNAKMTSITLPNTLEQIGVEAFNGVTTLTSITIPASVTKIGDMAFKWQGDEGESDSLTTITFKNESGLTNVGKSLFHGRGNISVTFPASLDNLGIAPSNPYNPTALSLGALQGWDYAKDVSFEQGSQFSNENGLLYSGTTLVANLNFTDPNYTGAQTIEIKDGTTEIGQLALHSNAGEKWFINTITIPSTVESIGYRAMLYSFKSTSTAIFKGVDAPRIGTGSFAEDSKVFVPSGAEGYGDYFKSVNVLGGDGSTVEIGTPTVETDEETGQQTTTTTITVKDPSGNVTSTTTTISTTVQDDTLDKKTITTTATTKDGETTIDVSASSGENLNKILGQIQLVQGKIEGATDTKTEVVISNDDGKGKVLIPSEVLSKLCQNEDNESTVELFVKQGMTEVKLTDEQKSMVGNSTVYDFSVIKTTDGEETNISQLGGYVKIYIPYDPNLGDVSDLGVYYIAPDGTKTLMDSEFTDSMHTHGSFVFETNHFSVYAALPLDDEDKVDDKPPYNPGDDDDEFVPPFIPSNDSDDTTLYIACCAAASVVALLAVIIIMNERKR